MDRRRFLRAVGAGGTRLAAGAMGLGLLSRMARADSHCDTGSWGRIVGTVGGAGGWTCDNHEGYKILEIFLTRGASQWETFWLPGAGAPNFSDYGMADLPIASLDWGDNTASFPCQSPDIPPSESDSQLMGTESDSGVNIYWGAPARPLYRRADIRSRVRMVTQHHNLGPHEAAIPFALSGLRLGNPRRSGMGAAVQRRWRAVEPDQLLPASYVLHHGGTLAPPAAAVAGTHPGLSRPLVVQVQPTDSFFDSLARTGISSESDELLLALRHEFRDRLRYRGFGNPVRSAGFDSYWVAAELLRDAPAMQSLFADELLVIDTAVAKCPTMGGDVTANTAHGAKTMLHAAASLLNSGPARYCCVIDRGLGGTYDTHGNSTINHLLYTTTNLYNVLHHLADIIRHPTANPDGLIDLDDTLIVINSEFGRTPMINGNTGRDHWPEGYTNILIGGPITGGPTIRGAIDATGNTTVAHRYSPADVRGALYLAAGIDPFADGAFRVSDFSDALRNGSVSEVVIRDRLREWILGV